MRKCQYEGEWRKDEREERGHMYIHWSHVWLAQWLHAMVVTSGEQGVSMPMLLCIVDIASRSSGLLSLCLVPSRCNAVLQVFYH